MSAVDPRGTGGLRRLAWLCVAIATAMLPMQWAFGSLYAPDDEDSSSLRANEESETRVLTAASQEEQRTAADSDITNIDPDAEQHRAFAATDAGNGNPFITIESPIDGNSYGAGVATSGLTLVVAVGNLPFGTHWHWQLDSPISTTGAADGNEVAIGRSALITGLTAGETYTVHVALVDPNESALDSAANVYAAASAAFTVSGPPTLVMDPTSLSFGATLQDQQDVTLSLVDGSFLTITDIVSDNPAFRVVLPPQAVSEATSESLTVRFTPNLETSDNGTITIYHDGSNSPSTLTVDGSGVNSALVGEGVTLLDAQNFIWDIGYRGQIGGGGNIISEFDRAFDGAFELVIGVGEFFDIFEPGQGSDTAAVEFPGTELAFDSVDHFGVTVSRKVYVPSNGAFVRYLEVL